MKPTIIDPSNVHILERDIEEFLWKNPESLFDSARNPFVKSWLGRQVALPSGIADLVGVNRVNSLVVVEVKNTPITSEALAQVCRYSYDLENIESHLFDYTETRPVWKIVVGSGKHENKIQFEADALSIILITFDVRLTLDLSGPYHWSREFGEELKINYEQLSAGDQFQNYKSIRTSKFILDQANEIISNSADGDLDV